MGVDERPELAELPETLASFDTWGEAITGARPDERFGGVTGQPGRTEAHEEIPERGERALVEVARLAERTAFPEDGTGEILADLADLT